MHSPICPTFISIRPVSQSVSQSVILPGPFLQLPVPMGLYGHLYSQQPQNFLLVIGHMGLLPPDC